MSCNASWYIYMQRQFCHPRKIKCCLMQTLQFRNWADVRGIRRLTLAAIIPSSRNKCADESVRQVRIFARAESKDAAAAAIGTFSVSPALLCAERNIKAPGRASHYVGQRRKVYPSGVMSEFAWLCQLTLAHYVYPSSLFSRPANWIVAPLSPFCGTGLDWNWNHAANLRFDVSRRTREKKKMHSGKSILLNEVPAEVLRAFPRNTSWDHTFESALLYRYRSIFTSAVLSTILPHLQIFVAIVFRSY